MHTYKMREREREDLEFARILVTECVAAASDAAHGGFRVGEVDVHEYEPFRSIYMCVTPREREGRG